MLTHRQKELLLLIKDRLAKDGIPPSFDEMRNALGLRSKSGIHRLILGLEERGFVRRLPYRARALELIAPPHGAPPHSTPSPPARTSPSRTRRDDSVPHNAFLSLPLYGRIAAGTPIEALSDVQERCEVPTFLFSGGKGKGRVEHYLLDVAGDSMIDAGILDGDRVIIRKADTADNGAIVVALVDENEATLKYFERRKNGIALIPANTHYETRVLPASRIKIQGVLTGLLRSY